MGEQDKLTLRRSANNMGRARRWVRNILLSIVVIVLIGAGWLAYTQFQISKAGGASSQEVTDVGIVLGAAMWGERPSPGLAERLERTAELYQEGRFKEIIVTGGKGAPSDPYSEAEGSKRYLESLGVPSEHIHLENESTSTLENLQNAKAILAAMYEEHSSVTIITHDFHGTRAREIAEKLAYSRINIETVTSRVMNHLWYFSRETLAYTKWKWDELWL